jgi:hypothetical protein
MKHILILSVPHALNISRVFSSRVIYQQSYACRQLLVLNVFHAAEPLSYNHANSTRCPVKFLLTSSLKCPNSFLAGSITKRPYHAQVKLWAPHYTVITEQTSVTPALNWRHSISLRHYHHHHYHHLSPFFGNGICRQPQAVNTKNANRSLLMVSYTSARSTSQRQAIIIIINVIIITTLQTQKRIIR